MDQIQFHFRAFAANYEVIEWISVALNLIFLVLLIRENMACWIFGIIGSLFSTWLFLSPDVKLYSEAVLYFIYAILGVYGWMMWHKRKGGEVLKIQKWKRGNHTKAMVVGMLLWVVIGGYMYINTDANLPWADSFTTAFSLVATYLEAKKVLEGWFYWIVINLFSIGLYWLKDIDKMAGMMLIYTILSVLGYLRWSRQMKLEASNSASITAIL